MTGEIERAIERVIEHPESIEGARRDVILPYTANAIAQRCAALFDAVAAEVER